MRELFKMKGLNRNFKNGQGLKEWRRKKDILDENKIMNKSKLTRSTEWLVSKYLSCVSMRDK